MGLKYDTLPKVKFETDKKFTNLVKEIETMRINLIKETIQHYSLLNMSLNDKQGNYNTATYPIKNEIRYDNYLLPGAFIGEPNHADFDEAAVIKFGRGNVWVHSVAKMGKWYEENVSTINTDTKYKCTLLNDGFEVSDTNTGFLKACLLLFSQTNNPDKYSEIKDIDFTFNGLLKNEYSLMRSMKFEPGDLNADVIYEIEYKDEDIYTGDIAINTTTGYGEIYFGERETIEYNGGKINEWGDNKKHNFTAMSWRNINDNGTNHYGMPCSILQNKYNVILRYIGNDALLLGATKPLSTGEYGDEEKQNTTEEK